MKRLLLICGMAAAFLVPSAMARGGTGPAIVLNESPVFNTQVDFTVTLDKGSAASVAVECYSPLDSTQDQWNGTPRFSATPGVPTVSPSVTMTAIAGSSCTAYLYRWVLKPNGSWQQTIATTLVFTSQ